MSDTVLNSFTLESLRDLLQTVGYRVEIVPNGDMPLLRSSTAGFAFDIRPGNRLASEDGGYVDFTFSAWLNIEGELPLDVVNRWNALRRFGRLQVVPGYLAMTMDVSFIGGVMPNHLRAQVEIWDHLVQALVPYLREELQKLDTVKTVVAPEVQAPVERKAAAEARVA
ncbi:MAG: YbjN domain-containing protein [Pseudomonadota bacterium]